VPRDLTIEQKRALAYLKLKGERAPVAEIRTKVRAAVNGLDEVLEEVGEEEARRRPAPEAWSVQEIVDHLTQSHRRSVGELRSLLHGESPAGDPIPASLLSEDPLGPPWPQSFQALRAVHESFLELLAGATDEIPQEARAQLVMVVKAADESGALRPLEWIEPLDWKSYAIALRAHTLEHIAQIQRTLEAVRSTSA